LSRFEIENADDHGMRLDARRMTGRVAVSLAVAIFAYLGLLFGGNLSLGPARGPNAFSSSSKDGQPLQLSARDGVRGILAADRRIAPKYVAFDSGEAILANPPTVKFAFGRGPSLSSPIGLPIHAIGAKAYDSRGPPTATA
jgi:hypothetical protein